MQLDKQAVRFFLLGALITMPAACRREGPAERTGEKLGGEGEKAGREVDEATGEAKEEAGDVKEKMKEETDRD